MKIDHKNRHPYLAVGLALEMINPDAKIANATISGCINFVTVLDVHSLFNKLELSAGRKNRDCK